MNQLKNTLLLLLLPMMLMAVSCADHDDVYLQPPEGFVSDTTATAPDTTVTDPPSDTTATAPVMPEARITGEVTYTAYPLLRNMNFVYPSRDPCGNPVMLSGTITMSRDLTPETKAQGFILYNHYTVFRADECPSKGKLDMQNILYLTAPHRNFITVSADYYGFGQTEDRMQAYCIGSANARASIDALTAARQLLAERGYTWYDDLLNVGYSQGGQTAIAVLKLATAKYPDCTSPEHWLEAAPTTWRRPTTSISLKAAPSSRRQWSAASWPTTSTSSWTSPIAACSRVPRSNISMTGG